MSFSNPRALTLSEIYSASKPVMGPSGTLPPMADVSFKKLYLQVSTGYDIPGVEGAGMGILPIGSWRNRGGGSPWSPKPAPSGPNGSFNY